MSYYNNSLKNIEYFEVNVIDNFDYFMSLREQWNHLAFAQTDETPFLCHEWFELWLKNFLGKNHLYTIVLYVGGDIAAIAPFYISIVRFKSVPVRKLGFISNAYSPLCNIICGNIDPTRRREYILLILDHITSRRDAWDIFEFGPLPNEILTLSNIEGYADRLRFSVVKEPRFANWYMDGIAFSGNEYLDNRSKNFRKELRKRWKHLEEEGTVEINVLSHIADMQEMMNDYYSVYGKSWKQKESIGPNFHRDLAILAEKNGWLRLGFIRIDGTPKATSYAIVSGRVGYILKSAYDLDMKSFGIGTMMRIEMIRRLIDQDNVSCIDLGPGDESYKKTFAPSMREFSSIIVFSKGIRGHLLAILSNKVLPVVRNCSPLNRFKSFISRKLQS